jgi:hypothetical protein
MTWRASSTLQFRKWALYWLGMVIQITLMRRNRLCNQIVLVACCCSIVCTNPPSFVHVICKHFSSHPMNVDDNNGQLLTNQLFQPSGSYSSPDVLIAPLQSPWALHSTWDSTSMTISSYVSHRLELNEKPSIEWMHHTTYASLLSHIYLSLKPLSSTWIPLWTQTVFLWTLFH